MKSLRNGLLIVAVVGGLVCLPVLAQTEDLQQRQDEIEEMLSQLQTDSEILQLEVFPTNGPAVVVQPGGTKVFSEPDTFVGECDSDIFGLRTCLSYEWGLPSVLGLFAGVSGASTCNARATWQTPMFSIPGEDSLDTTISATIRYDGKVSALVLAAGSARSAITITAGLYECDSPNADSCTEVLSQKNILNEECLASAILWGESCGKGLHDVSTVEFPVQLRPYKSYIVVVKNVAFAKAFLGAWATSNFNDDYRIQWENVTVTVEPNLAAMIRDVQDSLALLQNDMNSVGTDAGETWAMQIEARLLKGEALISMFVPESEGGYLHQVRELVSQRILQCEALGQNVQVSSRLFGQGDAYMTRGDYRKALQMWMKTYQSLSRQATYEIP